MRYDSPYWKQVDNCEVCVYHFDDTEPYTTLKLLSSVMTEEQTELMSFLIRQSFRYGNATGWFFCSGLILSTDFGLYSENQRNYMLQRFRKMGWIETKTESIARRYIRINYERLDEDCLDAIDKSIDREDFQQRYGEDP